MDGGLLDPGPILATDLWYSLGQNASLLWASFSHWTGGTGVGRCLTLSCSGLHRGVRSAQCQQWPGFLPTAPAFFLKIRMFVRLEIPPSFWATEVVCRGWEFTSESQSARWEYRGTRRWRSWGPEREHSHYRSKLWFPTWRIPSPQ